MPHEVAISRFLQPQAKWRRRTSWILRMDSRLMGGDHPRMSRRPEGQSDRMLRNADRMLRNADRMLRNADRMLPESVIGCPGTLIECRRNGRSNVTGTLIECSRKTHDEFSSA